jgi:hypothetical protein
MHQTRRQSLILKGFLSQKGINVKWSQFSDQLLRLGCSTRFLDAMKQQNRLHLLVITPSLQQNPLHLVIMT